jgi:ribosomal protein L21E
MYLPECENVSPDYQGYMGRVYGVSPEFFSVAGPDGDADIGNVFSLVGDIH